MLAIIFPWAILFADDNPLGGFLALIMQASVIGWIPAVIWAWKIVHRPPDTSSVPTRKNPAKKAKQQAAKG